MQGKKDGDDLVEANFVDSKFVPKREEYKYRMSESLDLAAVEKQPDFDEEARKLFKRLNVPDPTDKTVEYNRDDWGKPDCVYINPKTGAKFFIGDEQSASTLRHLESLDIYHIVNAKGNSGENYFEGDPRFTYYRFGVSNWYSHTGVKTSEGVLQFFAPVHKFIDDAMD